jgi:hypothetical protein
MVFSSDGRSTLVGGFGGMVTLQPPTLPLQTGTEVMAKNERRLPRKPATKDPYLRKKLQRGKSSPSQSQKPEPNCDPAAWAG